MCGSMLRRGYWSIDSFIFILFFFLFMCYMPSRFISMRVINVRFDVFIYLGLLCVCILHD